MNKRKIDLVEIFNQAWSELYCPPVRLSIVDESGDSDGCLFTVANGIIYLSPKRIPRGVDPERYLLWFFRHQLAHIHHCPYDIKTAYSLERAAYRIINNWDLAYLAMRIFSEVQVDLRYLPSKYGELPYHVRIVGREDSGLFGRIMDAIYLCVNPAFKIENLNLAEAAREIIFISHLERPWHLKVQMIASVLGRLMRMEPRLFSKREIKKSIRSETLYVREDFLNSTIERILETYGLVRDEDEAQRFFEQWLRPRLPSDENERLKKTLSLNLRGSKRILKDLKVEKKDSKPAKKRPAIGGDLKGEPHLSVSSSKPYEKIRERLDEILWRRYWFKSRAQQAIIEYITESRRRRPAWSIMRYPDEWYIEDDIEELDLEASLEEGPIIPEVTTLRWIEEPTPYGQSFSSGFVPSAIIVLDASLSMIEAHNEAAVAAFIAYLSARRSGGETAVITFSTGFASADWRSPDEVKELILSMRFDEFTIFPLHEIRRFISEKAEPCFIVVITDGGWQNLDEAIPFLEDLSDLGHRIAIFLIKGGEYSDRIDSIRRIPNLQIYSVTDPERDLNGLVLSETMKSYGRFLT
ncbi:MAG TPA: VWA domain-containing protein [Candidatus Bathyarchaeota archaeon]|nr:VWA domain-containing protein [Candidatus Bathyarchaeota archaeon]